MSSSQPHYGRPPTTTAANRPASRALGRSTALNAHNVAPPPPTARSGLAAGPVTGLAPPATAIRLRPVTGIRGIQERPTTSYQGISAPPKTAGGPGSGRAVQDRTFWISDVKQRLSVIDAELGRLRADANTFERDAATVSVLEKRAQAAATELRGLQGQLGDYNTLIDKIHTDTELDDVVKQVHDLAVRNAGVQSSVDIVFSKRQEILKAIEESDAAAAKAHEEARLRVNEHGNDEQRKEWAVLDEELKSLTLDSKNLKGQLNRLRTLRAQASEDLQRDPIRLKIWNAVSRRQSLKRELAIVRDAVDPDADVADGAAGAPGDSAAAPVDDNAQLLARLDTLDSKEAILEFIRQLNAEMSTFSTRQTALEKEIFELREHRETFIVGSTPGGSGASDSGGESSAAAAAAAAAKTEAERVAKYEELVKKDQEMTAFLADAPTRISTSLEKQESLRSEISKTLIEFQTIAIPVDGIAPRSVDALRVGSAGNAIPSQEKIQQQAVAELKRMTGDLEAKEREAQQAAETEKALKHEREKLEGDLARIRELETGIGNEMVLAKQRLAKLAADLENYSLAESTASKFEKQGKTLENEKELLSTKFENASQTLGTLKASIDQKKKLLSGISIYAELDVLQTRVKKAEATISATQSYIQAKQKDVEYETEKSKILNQLVVGCNDILVQTYM